MADRVAVLIGNRTFEPDSGLAGLKYPALDVEAVAKLLAAEGIAARVVSMPCWEIFDAQPEDYRRRVIPPTIGARVSVEAGVSHGWHRYTGDYGEQVSIDHFGASAPAPVLFEKFGFTPQNVVAKAKESIRRSGG